MAYVNDGDTLRLRDGRKVRLLQIDAPELRGDCYAKAALAALRQLAPNGTRVTLELDPRLGRAPTGTEGCCGTSSCPAAT